MLVVNAIYASEDTPQHTIDLVLLLQNALFHAYECRHQHKMAEPQVVSSDIFGNLIKSYRIERRYYLKNYKVA